MDKEKIAVDYTNETLLTTPKPKASSTVHRQHIRKVNLQKIPLTFSPNLTNITDLSSSSLGILNINDIKMNSYLDEKNSTAQVATEKWQEQRAFASSILERSNGLGLPSRYLRASESLKNATCVNGSNSTVNETDLMEKDKLLFKPDEISTPRSSCASNNSDKDQNSLFRQSIASKSLAELSNKIRNSDMGLAELCNNYYNFLINNEGPSYSEESFTPGELAGDKLAQVEESWNREMNVLGNAVISDSIFSIRDPSMSVSEFFRKKSELDDSILKKSPEKQEVPIPLIDKSVDFQIAENSNVLRNTSESILNLSELEKAISINDNTAKIIELIAKTKSKRITNDNRQSSTKENFKHSTKRESSEISSKLVTFKTPEPLKDSRNVTQETADLDNSNSHTASSLESLPGGKLPIETNRIELIWGCVRTGKRKVQSFTLRNKSHNKLRLQISSSNTCFRILSDQPELESVSILPILMYPSESRHFAVSFHPTSVGAVVAKLNFTPVSSKLQMQQQKRQILMMYGYGGHANIEIQHVLKDTNMKMWLSLGKLDNMPQLNQKVELQNIGNISAFACLKFNSKSLYESSKVLLDPTELVLHPKEKISVALTYTPTKEDAKHLFAITNNQVMEIGCVQIVTGAEIVRGRIRRLCRKLKQETGQIENILIEELSKKYPNEKMPDDLELFTETVGSVKELIQSFDSKEITITLEKDSERTLIGQIGGIDETSMFQSLCEGVNTIVGIKPQCSSCSVEPTNIILTPPNKTADAIVLTSHSNFTLHFETAVEPFGVIKVQPKEGMLSPGDTILLNLSCNTQKLKDEKYFKLSVYVDDDVFDIDIKVILLKQK